MSLSEDLHPRRVLLALFGALTLLVIAGARPTNAQDAPIDNLERASAAVVRIEAVGTFIDFYEGEQQNIPGYGSGFIIDPSGLVVTNNHVVTGGALYRVYVGGSSRPVNARVVGVSECSDLAVIDLQGEGYPYLAWSDLRPLLGKRVFAAGYPLGEREYKLTEGKIKSTREDGDTDWASIDYTLQHSATLQPGNSGGPLLDAYGRVMGVNVAKTIGASEYFAIPDSIAERLANTLATDVDVDSLGINGVVVTSDDESGIWISSVASGTPADNLGLIAGDIILKVEGVDVGLDGTMLDYCDIIQSHGPDDVMSVEIYRSVSDKVLSGQFNGRELAVAPYDEFFDDEPAVTSNAEYKTVHDSKGAVSFDVPDTWTHSRERPWNWDGTVVGSQLIVANDIEAFLNDWSEPGVAFSWSSTLQKSITPRQIVSALDLTDDCEYSDYDEWDDEYWVGYSAFYADCPNNMAALVTAVQPLDGSYIYKYEFYSDLDTGEVDFDQFVDTYSIDANRLVEEKGMTLRTVVDESRRIFVSVPVAWRDIASEPIEYEGDHIGVRFVAAIDVQDFEDYWGEPGISIRVYDDYPDANLDDWLDFGDLDEHCNYVSRFPFESENYMGKYDLWTRCGGASSGYRDIALVPKDGTDLLVSIGLVAVTRDETDAVEAIIDSLSVLSAFTTDAQQPDSGPYITVIAENLNVRKGPGTSFEVTAQITRGTMMNAVGQANNCAWLLIADANGKRGWVSGDSKYTQLTGACADLPEVK